MIAWESWINTIALALVAIASLVHLKAMRKTRPDCESVGFAIVMACAVGAALEPWWPKLTLLVGVAGELPAFGFQTVFHVGLGVVAIALMRGDLHELIDRAGEVLARRTSRATPFRASAWKPYDEGPR